MVLAFSVSYLKLSFRVSVTLRDNFHVSSERGKHHPQIFEDKYSVPILICQRERGLTL